ncbi:MAG: cyclic nucleotide-binding domain-containing protein [Magnetococcales bacterium]|nr:cyclic nucleotide-binding domain-containing protein [Magnetococcales bacterium]
MLFQERQPEFLGKVYENGAVILRQGEAGGDLFFILEGQVEVITGAQGEPSSRLAVLEKGGDDLFGEMACFDDLPRSATVRALGRARVLTMDREIFLERIAQDPSLALKILTSMSQRLWALNLEVIQLRRDLDERSRQAS